jgi:hypothetical protein
MARQLLRRCRKTWASWTNAEIQVVENVNMYQFKFEKIFQQHHHQQMRVPQPLKFTIAARKKLQK